MALNSTPPPVETDDGAFERNFGNSAANWEKMRATSYYQLGYLSGLSGSFAEAIDYCQSAIRRDSSLTEAYVNLISGYLSVGRLADAERVLNLALTKFPDNEYLRRFKNGQASGK